MTLQITVARLGGGPAFTETPARVTTRLTLGRGEVFRLPRGCSTLRVVGGTLWLTHRGCDVVRDAGPVALPGEGDDALLSGLGREPVVIEFNGVDETWWRQPKSRFWTDLRQRFGGRRWAATNPSA